MALFTLSTVLFTVYGSIACCISCRSCGSDDEGHDRRHLASSSRSSYGAITTQPYQPHPSPSYTRESYAHVDCTNNTLTITSVTFLALIVSHHRTADNALGSLRTLPPLAFSSSGDSQPVAPIIPCRREAIHSDAPLPSLVVLPNITVVLSDYNTPENLREKARHMKREEQEAYKLAKHANKRRDYNAEVAHKRDAIKHKKAMEYLNNEAAEVIFRQKNEGRTDGMVDLHGLYVDEALEYAKKVFQSALLRNDKVVRFIVGKGLHAKNNKAKIRPALERLCKERGMAHYLDPRNAGVLVVQC